MSTLKAGFLNVAVRVEDAAARLFGASRQPTFIEPYAGYATADALVVQGRVHSELTRSEARPGQGVLTNIRQMGAMFLTHEVPDAEVIVSGTSVTTDEEGYFHANIPRDGRTGWIDCKASLPRGVHSVSCPVLAPENTDAPMIISDIDDTIMQTGAYSLARNLWTTFSGNALTRRVYADAAVLLHRLHRGGEHPVFYVSSSPWNIYAFLNDVFARADVVRGPMFLRDLGLSKTKLVTEGHGNHKGASIDTILDANPTRPAILIGDTGQEDAVIYRGVIERYPGRVRAVVLRTPGPGLDENDRLNITRLRETGALVLHGRSFAGFAEQLEPALGAP